VGVGASRIPASPGFALRDGVTTQCHPAGEIITSTSRTTDSARTVPTHPPPQHHLHTHASRITDNARIVPTHPYPQHHLPPYITDNERTVPTHPSPQPYSSTPSRSTTYAHMHLTQRTVHALSLHTTTSHQHQPIHLLTHTHPHRSRHTQTKKDWQLPILFCV
jgi:hypothetical protein